MTDTLIVPQVADPETEREPPKVAHIVSRENHADADTCWRCLAEVRPAAKAAEAPAARSAQST